LTGGVAGGIVNVTASPVHANLLNLTVNGGDKWDASVGVEGTATTALIANLRSAQDEAGGWNAIVQAGADGGARQHAVLQVGGAAAADGGLRDHGAETLSLRRSPPRRCSRSSRSTSPRSSSSTRPPAASCSTARSPRTADAQPRALLLRLASDVWEPRLGQRGYAPTDALLGGFVQPFGWDAVLQPRLSASSLRRVDEATLQLTMPQAAAYALAAPETVDVLVPSTAVLSRRRRWSSAPCRLLGGLLAARPEEGTLQQPNGSSTPRGAAGGRRVGRRPPHACGLRGARGGRRREPRQRQRRWVRPGRARRRRRQRHPRADCRLRLPAVRRRRGDHHTARVHRRLRRDGGDAGADLPAARLVRRQHAGGARPPPPPLRTLCCCGRWCRWWCFCC